MKQSFKHLSIDAVTQFFEGSGMPKFRASQVLDWVYSKDVNDYSDMSSLPKSMRKALAQALPLHKPEIISKQISLDGSRKYVLRFFDGSICETVGMPSHDGRLTACISSQSGCGMACSFCATGQQGLTRNLYPGEISDQVFCVQNDFGSRVSNIVVMGQGEPFANYDNTLHGLQILNHPKLLNIGARHITVSTCGIIEGIDKFSNVSEQYTLAVSLHSARQATRDVLMPHMGNQRLGTLRKALQGYSEATGRRFSFEYALMRGINDSEEELHALVQYCRRLLCHVNLIPLNNVVGSVYKPVSSETMHEWNEYLNAHGIASTIRNSRGSDIDAACGQLAGKLR